MPIAVFLFVGASSLFTYGLLLAGLFRNPGAQESGVETSSLRQVLSPRTHEANIDTSRLIAEVPHRLAPAPGSPPQGTLPESLSVSFLVSRKCSDNVLISFFPLYLTPCR